MSRARRWCWRVALVACIGVGPVAALAQEEPAEPQGLEQEQEQVQEPEVEQEPETEHEHEYEHEHEHEHEYEHEYVNEREHEPEDVPDLAPDVAVLDSGETETPVEEMWVPSDDLFSLPELQVTFDEEDVFRLGGSAQLIDETQLEAFEYDDPNSVLLQTPGLYVRQEDGFGLRPNIGIRGANSDRSKKITLMEDDVLFGPAPYAAPAAYYFPNMSRMVGVEVFKGPAAVLYGPNTIGGAVNLRSREIPDEPSGEVDVSFGRFWSRRVHTHYGARNDWGGFLVEGVHLGSAGYKELDSGDPDTGFQRTELGIVGELHTDLDAEVFHRVQLRLGYSRERSNETYLGLTDADFSSNADRRYAASQLDRMTFWRTQVRLDYEVSIGDHVELRTTAYRHDFDRTWTRLNRFRDNTDLLGVLTNPTGRRQIYYEVLTGARDSASVSDPLQRDQDLMVIDNDRRFISQGVQSRLRFDAETGPFTHTVEVGLRFHYDEIERNHVERGYRMENQQLVFDGQEPIPQTVNVGQAWAFSSYLAYGLEFFGFTVTPGLRLEVIETAFEDALVPSATQDDLQVVLIPGLGIQYAVTENFDVLAGIHRGFSPVAPGQPDGVDPEFSTNYELGARYADRESETLAEVIGFFNDYSNITGQCSGSAGCAPDLLDRQFNGGSAHVLGVETVGAHTFQLDEALWLPLRGTYTFTYGTFRTSFDSDNPQFGQVTEGDELPYVPQHQLRFQAGLRAERWSVNTSLTYVGEMREEAGSGDPAAGELPLTDDYVIWDALGSYRLFEPFEVYLRFENLLNQRPIVARRPFGARPTRPFQVTAGVRGTL